MTPENTASGHPTAIRVGATGHRPGRLSAADPIVLRQRVREALESIAAGAPGAPIVVISPLAEGADRIIAREAVELGHDLICVLPFPRDDYASDFAGVANRAEYRALLDLALEVIELRGSRETPEATDASYMAVGEQTVAHADVMLAIWDGARARGNGGTGDVVALALDCSEPVIWIDVAPPHQILLLTRGQDGVVTEPLQRLIGLLGR